MRKTYIILLIYAMCILPLVSCNNMEAELNTTVEISQDVKQETEPSLKVILNEVITLNKTMKYNSRILNNNGELILMEDLYNGEQTTDVNYYKININENYGKVEFVETVVYRPHDYNATLNKPFLIKDLGNNKVEISPFNNLDTYVIDKKFIENDESSLVLWDKGVLEITYEVEGKSIYKFYDTSSGEVNVIEIPEYLSIILWQQTSDNKMLVALPSDSNYYTWDRIGVVDRESKEIEQEVKVDEFCATYSLDEERIFLFGANGGVNVYDVKNKIQKKFLDYDTFTATENYNSRENIICDLGHFSSKDKIYFTVIEDSIIKVKVATLNGVDIEESITVYELLDDMDNSIPSITLTNDDKEMIIYHNDKEYFTKIKLSK